MSQSTATATAIAPVEPTPEWPYLLPMGVFMAFIFVGGLAEWLFPWAYVGRTLVVGGLLVWIWPRVKRDVAWTHLPLGVLVGVVGTVQWIGMESLLVHLVGRKGFNLAIVQLVSNRFPRALIHCPCSTIKRIPTVSALWSHRDSI